jgi:hypothetical protein
MGWGVSDSIYSSSRRLEPAGIAVCGQNSPASTKSEFPPARQPGLCAGAENIVDSFIFCDKVGHVTSVMELCISRSDFHLGLLDHKVQLIIGNLP